MSDLNGMLAEWNAATGEANDDRRRHLCAQWCIDYGDVLLREAAELRTARVRAVVEAAQDVVAAWREGREVLGLGPLADALDTHGKGGA